MKRVAVIGTGIMGAHLGRRLARAGFDVRAWNRTAQKAEVLAADGVVPVARLGDALTRADAAIVMLSGGPVIDALLFGEPAGIAALPRDALVVVMSSIAVETARAQAARAAALGYAYLDAPVSGGEPGARDGTLAILVGGEPAAHERAAPLFTPLGTATWLGPAGSGQLAKLANQVIVGGTLVAIAEALTLAEHGGADPAAVRQALMGGFGDSKVLRVLGERMVHGDFEPGSPAAYQLRDMRTASALARGMHLKLDQLDAVIERFEALARHGEIERDVAIVVREVARRATREPAA
ncbi:MAG: NAD(P)-dependent oxidoreductase [Proteobacteria bacterium]|nr:NAD(P)-dependent oxidoreductase [Pseudomonadota bacterium]